MRIRKHKAQSAIEYAMLGAFLVATFLVTQAHIARGMRGQIQTGSDQLSDQYGYGVSWLDDRSAKGVSSTEWALPGWNHPTTITTVRGNERTSGEKAVAPLDRTYP